MCVFAGSWTAALGVCSQPTSSNRTMGNGAAFQSAPSAGSSTPHASTSSFGAELSVAPSTRRAAPADGLTGLQPVISARPAASRQTKPFSPVRCYSQKPENTVYGGPSSPVKPVTLRTLQAKYAKRQPISMATAYDYPSAVHVSGGLD